jgi:hypothetical protein
MRRAAVASALLILLLAPAEGRAADPVGGGSAQLQLDKRFRAFLMGNRIQLLPSGGATQHLGVMRFSVVGGELDPGSGKGELDLEGSMVFRDARKRVAVRKITIKTGAAPFVAKVGGSQLKVATARTFDSRRGFGTKLVANRLRLTSKVATRLNKKLRPPVPFAAGQPIGDLISVSQPLVTAIVPARRVEVVLDGAFLAKLGQQFVSVNPIFPAEHDEADFTLPIIDRSTLAPDLSGGTLRSGGELEFLELGRGQVFWHELWFDFASKVVLAEADVEPSPPYAGKLGQVQVLDLDGGASATAPTARTIGLSGAILTLPSATAATFNQAFAQGTEVFQAGERVATLSFTAQAR